MSYSLQYETHSPHSKDLNTRSININPIHENTNKDNCIYGVRHLSSSMTSAQVYINNIVTVILR